TPWTPTVVDSAPAAEPAAGGQAAAPTNTGWPNLAPPYSSVPTAGPTAEPTAGPTATPTSAPAPAAAPAPSAPAASSAAQVVQRGDSLWTIAARHLGPGATDAQIAAEWPRWWDANRAMIGSDPNLLHPGEQLQSPAAA
ncbi:LysM peptidoglycan-binding domain-containing protein, partial [Frankia sp. AgB1.8]